MNNPPNAEEVTDMLERVRKLLRAEDDAWMDCGSEADFNHVITAIRAEAGRGGFDRGFQLAAKIEQGAMRQALADHVLSVLGKDAGDGAIDLGTLGQWFATDAGAVEAWADR